MHTTKNYSDKGGNRLVIGGELEIKAGAVISGDGAANLAAAATATVFGGVKAAEAGAGDTVEAKIGEDGKLYVPGYPTAATEAAAGLVKAAEAGAGDTVEAKIGEDGKLYVPEYPTAENQAAIAADADAATVRTAYIDLILKLKAAGIMAADA